MQPTTARIRFDKSGYYFIVLLALIVAGFWNSYFSRFFTGTNDYNFYFHFHALMMSLWVITLIVQPLLIRKKKLTLHRVIGRFTYVMMPVMLLSVLLILNSGMKGMPAEELTFSQVIFPFRDFLFLLFFFSIGVIYRRKMQIHARAMIITGIVFIEPALFRFLGRAVFKGMGTTAFYVGLFLIFSLLITLIIMERKQKKGRWLFPVFLIVDLVVYALLIFEVPLSLFDPLVRWYAQLPLT